MMWVGKPQKRNWSTELSQAGKRESFSRLVVLVRKFKANKMWADIEIIHMFNRVPENHVIFCRTLDLPYDVQFLDCTFFGVYVLPPEDAITDILPRDIDPSAYLSFSGKEYGEIKQSFPQTIRNRNRLCDQFAEWR